MWSTTFPLIFFKFSVTKSNIYFVRAGIMKMIPNDL